MSVASSKKTPSRGLSDEGVGVDEADFAVLGQLEEAQFGEHVVPALDCGVHPFGLEFLHEDYGGAVFLETLAFALGDVGGAEDEEGDAVVCAGGFGVQELVGEDAGADEVAIVHVVDLSRLFVGWLAVWICVGGEEGGEGDSGCVGGELLGGSRDTFARGGKPGAGVIGGLDGESYEGRGEEEEYTESDRFRVGCCHSGISKTIGTVRKERDVGDINTRNRRIPARMPRKASSSPMR